MYTFNLSRVQKQAAAKAASKTVTASKGDTNSMKGDESIDTQPQDKTKGNNQEENKLSLPDDESKRA